MCNFPLSYQLTAYIVQILVYIDHATSYTLSTHHVHLVLAVASQVLISYMHKLHFAQSQSVIQLASYLLSNWRPA